MNPIFSFLEKYNIAASPFKIMETDKIVITEGTLKNAESLKVSDDLFDEKGIFLKKSSAQSVKLVFEHANPPYGGFSSYISAPTQDCPLCPTPNIDASVVDVPNGNITFYGASMQGNVTFSGASVGASAFVACSVAGCMNIVDFFHANQYFCHFHFNDHTNAIQKQVPDYVKPLEAPPKPKTASKKKNKGVPFVFEEPQYPSPIPRCVMKDKKKMEFHFLPTIYDENKNNKAIVSVCGYAFLVKGMDILTEQDSATAIRFFSKSICTVCRKMVVANPIFSNLLPEYTGYIGS